VGKRLRWPLLLMVLGLGLGLRLRPGELCALVRRLDPLGWACDSYST